MKNLRATLGILTDARSMTRIRFLRAADRIGLIVQLQAPITAEGVAGALNVTDVGLLRELLDVGVAMGELRLRGGRYSLRGSRIRALASDSGEALRGFTGEVAEYHSDVYRDLPALLRGKERGYYLDDYDELVARSSLLLEPFVARFVRSVVKARPTHSVLEIGCGTGIYVRHLAEACPQLRVVGIDMSERVTALATANFDAWGLADRCTALHADIRQADTANLGGRYDVITLHNNVYYFSSAERGDLFADLRRRLTRGGRLVLTSYFAGKTLAAAQFDLVLRSTAGCSPLPERTELRDALHNAGYRRVVFHRLLATDPLFGVIADVP
ncbi:MAG TPA: methyltransferase domain-containing protein [Pseudonocardiaceae bacterium]|nr:methyltransferase domain-containing protein [Pseudonocardiaceae bacterium]